MYTNSVPALVSKNVGNTLTNFKTWGGVIYNVKEYGAKGDGKKDDTAAIQSTINTAISNGGGVVLFPPGSYLCGTLTATGLNIVLRGSGESSTILFTGTTGNWLNLRARFGIVEDLGIETTQATTGSSIINIDNSGWVYIRNIQMGFYSHIYNGISVSSVIGPVQAVYISNCGIYKHRGGGVILDTTDPASSVINDIFIENCWIQWLASDVGQQPPATSIGIQIKSQYAALQAINITNCEVSSSYFTLYASGCRFLHVTSCYFDGYNFFDTVNISTFNNCWFSGSSGPNTATNAMDIRNCIGIQFTICHINPESVLTTSSGDMIIQGTCNHVLIDGCMLGGSGYIGIILNGGDNITITKNYFGKNGAFLNNQNMIKGIDIQGSFTGYANIQQNDMREMATPISNGATTTGKIFAQSNLGYNPAGALTSPTMPTSGNGAVNAFPYRVRVSVAGGSGVSIFINSIAIGLASGSFILEPGESITLTYTTAPTTWVWQGL